VYVEINEYEFSGLRMSKIADRFLLPWGSGCRISHSFSWMRITPEPDKDDKDIKNHLFF